MTSGTEMLLVITINIKIGQLHLYQTFSFWHIFYSRTSVTLLEISICNCYQEHTICTLEENTN